VTLFLVHHGDAVGPDVDTRRPLSPKGQAQAARAAQQAAARGAKPVVIWHSGKLRARQTAEAFWRACNPFAEFSATRDLQPDDPPDWMRDRLHGETRDVLIAGHFPFLPRLLGALLAPGSDQFADFPLNGVVAITNDDGDDDRGAWREIWRLSQDDAD
jgi:phosphohistidine phosphatase